MGACTSVIDSDVEIVDMDGLKDYIRNCKEGKYSHQKDRHALKNYAKALKIKVNSFDSIKTLDFYGFDGWKIISYWYDEFLVFLRDIAVFIEGQVMLEFESHDEGGGIEFHNGECIIHTGRMAWSKISADKFAAKKNMPKMSDEIEERLIARQL